MRVRVVSGAISALVLTVTTLVVSLLLVKLTVSFLTREEAGFWFLLLSFSQFILFFDLGFSPTLTRMIGITLGRENNEANQWTQVATMVSTLQKTSIIVAIAIFGVGLPTGPLIFKNWLNISNFDQLTWILFLIGAVTNIAGGVSLATMNGLGHVAQERMIRSGGQILWLVLSAMALKLGFGLQGLATSWLLQGVSIRIVAMIYLRRENPEICRGRQKFDSAVLSEMLVPSLKWAVTSLGAILILQSGNWVVAKTMGTAAVASYETINRILAALMTLGILSATASSPFLSRLHGAGDSHELKKLIFLNIRLGMTIVLSAAIFISFFGQNIIEVWVGPELFPGNGTLYFGLAMAVLETHHVILATAVMASGQVPFASWAIGAGLLNLAFGFLFVPRFGLVGMAAATFFAQILTNNWYAPFFAFRRFKISLREYFAETGLQVVRTAGILGLVAWALKMSSTKSDLLQILILSLLFILASLVTSLFSLLTSEERQSAKNYIGRRLFNA